MSESPAGGTWSPTCDHSAIEARAELLNTIRAFFTRRSVLEVETPILSTAGNSDPGLTQWETRSIKTWLRTSPEYAMKRLLAAGSGDIYELGRVFRGDESGRHHNREFTLLEWYRVGWKYHALMNEVGELIDACWPGSGLAEQRFSYRELFRQFAGIDPLRDPDGTLRDRLQAAHIELPDPTRRECLDLLLSQVIQPQLPDRTLTFVYDFPPDQAALARVRQDATPVAERFELFLGSVELANGYQELTDPIEQRQRFDAENAARRKRGDAPVVLDEQLLAAMSSGLPECAGVALGVDRLLMAMTGASHLRDVLVFPAERA